MPEETRQYAEVILPLPLYGTFTYNIPANLTNKIGVGYRVIVPFGRKKYYTAIVSSLTPVAPKDFELKDIVSVLDDGPVLRYPQLKLWQWISEYYLCAVGDVYKAAVPAGLKIESETFIELNPDYEENEDERLTEREAIIVQILDHSGRMPLGDIEKRTGLQNAETITAKMIEKGIVMVSEKLVERYRSKKETYLRLAVNRHDDEAMHAAFDAVKGAPKQEKLLIALIDALNKRGRTGECDDIPRSTLLESTGLSSAIASALASKGIIEIFTREINRFRYLGTDLGRLPVLSEAQNKALSEIHNGFLEKDIILLHGVTSSGKTEMYIHLIDYVLNKGEQILFLVPEIALTTQLTRRLQKVFGNKVIIYQIGRAHV